jgi:O-antigen/teichoic acid export membrane protein
LRPFWRLALEHWIMLLGNVLVWSRSELAVLQWLGTAADIAQFSVGAQLAGPVQMATTLFTAPVALHAARHNTEAGRGALASRMSTILRLSRAVSGCAALLAGAVAPVAVPLLFGTAYEQAVRLVPLLALSAWVYAQLSIYSALAQGLERPRYALVSMAVGGLVLLLVCAASVPRWGALGAAAARLATQCASLAVCGVLVSRLLPGITIRRDLLSGGVIFGLPLLAMAGVVSCVRGAAAMGANLLLVCGALLAARWLGIVRASDLDALRPRLAVLPQRLSEALETAMRWGVTRQQCSAEGQRDRR